MSNDKISIIDPNFEDFVRSIILNEEDEELVKDLQTLTPGPSNLISIPGSGDQKTGGNSDIEFHDSDNDPDFTVDPVHEFSSESDTLSAGDISSDDDMRPPNSRPPSHIQIPEHYVAESEFVNTHPQLSSSTGFLQMELGESDDDMDYIISDDELNQAVSDWSDDEDTPLHMFDFPRINFDVTDDIPVTYLGKDDTEWYSEEPSRCIRTRAENTIRGLPGLRGPARTLGVKPSPIEVWKLYMDDQIMQEILLRTNNKLECERAKIDPHDKYKLRRLRPTNEAEIDALLAVFLLSAIMKGNTEDVGSLFSSGITGRPIFRAAMSEKRFEVLIACLRFDNPNTRAERRKVNRAAPILWVFEKFVENCKKLFAISELTCIDEMLIPFRGGTPFTVYMPSKPGKYGIKLMVLTDARNSYMYDAYIYSGKGSDGFGLTSEEKELKVPTQALIKLTNCIKNSGKNITADNYFCSVEACRELTRRKLTLVGTMRKNKKEIPQNFLHKKQGVSTVLYLDSMRI
ncbi:piggyBac transposable element-derived protein 4-like [Cimex lectularius]|uniref:PiggyBac transposable element-derived protein domain-containing protein n=1 Tax=Cimex lectularius TaxID=79782 RepID=A0A8I6SRC6_CIMLE|nr:piggyBac transposable element-derived protein 4-like [Cimex lectularius]